MASLRELQGAVRATRPEGMCYDAQGRPVPCPPTTSGYEGAGPSGTMGYSLLQQRLGFGKEQASGYGRSTASGGKAAGQQFGFGIGALLGNSAFDLAKEAASSAGKAAVRGAIRGRAAAPRPPPAATAPRPSSGIGLQTAAIRQAAEAVERGGPRNARFIPTPSNILPNGQMPPRVARIVRGTQAVTTAGQEGAAPERVYVAPTDAPSRPPRTLADLFAEPAGPEPQISAVSAPPVTPRGSTVDVSALGSTPTGQPAGSLNQARDLMRAANAASLDTPDRAMARGIAAREAGRVLGDPAMIATADGEIAAANSQKLRRLSDDAFFAETLATFKGRNSIAQGPAYQAEWTRRFNFPLNIDTLKGSNSLADYQTRVQSRGPSTMTAEDVYTGSPGTEERRAMAELPNTTPRATPASRASKNGISGMISSVLGRFSGRLNTRPAETEMRNLASVDTASATAAPVMPLDNEMQNLSAIPPVVGPSPARLRQDEAEATARASATPGFGEARAGNAISAFAAAQRSRDGPPTESQAYDIARAVLLSGENPNGNQTLRAAVFKNKNTKFDTKKLRSSETYYGYLTKKQQADIDARARELGITVGQYLDMSTQDRSLMYQESFTATEQANRNAATLPTAQENAAIRIEAENEAALARLREQIRAAAALPVPIGPTTGRPRLNLDQPAGPLFVRPTRPTAPPVVRPTSLNSEGLQAARTITGVQEAPTIPPTPTAAAARLVRPLAPRAGPPVPRPSANENRTRLDFTAPPLDEDLAALLPMDQAEAASNARIRAERASRPPTPATPTAAPPQAVQPVATAPMPEASAARKRPQSEPGPPSYDTPSARRPRSGGLQPGILAEAAAALRRLGDPEGAQGLYAFMNRQTPAPAYNPTPPAYGASPSTASSRSSRSSQPEARSSEFEMQDMASMAATSVPSPRTSPQQGARSNEFEMQDIASAARSPAGTPRTLLTGLRGSLPTPDTTPVAIRDARANVPAAVTPRTVINNLLGSLPTPATPARPNAVVPISSQLQPTTPRTPSTPGDDIQLLTPGQDIIDMARAGSLNRAVTPVAPPAPMAFIPPAPNPDSRFVRVAGPSIAAPNGSQLAPTTGVYSTSVTASRAFAKPRTAASMRREEDYLEQQRELAFEQRQAQLSQRAAASQARAQQNAAQLQAQQRQQLQQQYQQQNASLANQYIHKAYNNKAGSFRLRR